jgi:hypothetical protein
MLVDQLGTQNARTDQAPLGGSRGYHPVGEKQGLRLTLRTECHPHRKYRPRDTFGLAVLSGLCLASPRLGYVETVETFRAVSRPVRSHDATAVRGPRIPLL